MKRLGRLQGLRGIGQEYVRSIFGPIWQRGKEPPDNFASINTEVVGAALKLDELGMGERQFSKKETELQWHSERDGRGKGVENGVRQARNWPCS